MQNKNPQANNPCGLCRAFGLPPPCRGHGGAGEGDSGSAEENKHKDEKQLSDTTTAPQTGDTKLSKTDHYDAAQLMLSSSGAIHLAAGLLSIEAIKLPHGILIFRGKAELTTEEKQTLREFINAVKTTFDEFKQKLEEEGVSTKQFTADIKNDELTIKINNPKYYNEFIQLLNKKNLLPNADVEWREEKKWYLMNTINPHG